MERIIKMEDGKKNALKKLVIDRLPKRFNEGLFWGNGSIGGFLYVSHNSLRFSVDSVMLWETRDTTRDMPAARFQDFIREPHKFHNGTYTRQVNLETPGIWRTHLPGLSLNIALAEEIIDFYGETDLETACSHIRVTLKNGRQVNGFVYVDSNVNILRVELDTKDAKVEIRGWDKENTRLSNLAAWNYPDYKKQTDGEILHVLQPFSKDGMAVISLLHKEEQIYIAFHADNRKERIGTEGADAERANTERVDAEGTDAERTDNGFSQKIVNLKDSLVKNNGELLRNYKENEEAYKKAHKASWQEFWSLSDIRIPGDRLQQAYYLEMYKIFSNERRGSRPVTLQGIWNNDTRMPAWYGDWHNDLNVQSCYWAAFKTNHIELAESYIDYYTKAMPRLTERAYKLFGIENALHCPVMMGPEGYGAGGEWCFWNLLLGPELFVATDFCWYYEYSGDKNKLKESIYPFVERVINLYMGIAFEGGDGYLHIPFTNSPEVFKDSGMLIKEDATVVISTLHYLLDHMEDYAKLLGKDEGKFKAFDQRLAPVKITDKGYPLFPGEELFESHRHFCHLYPIFPLGTDIHSDIALKTLNAVIDKGFTEYAAWSFPYLSIFASRCGLGNMARTMLEIYCMAFRSPNTFVVNGDPNRNGLLRISDTNAGEASDAFTLEAGFILPAALSEMFVHRSGDMVYIAYGIPDEWREGSCENMTIEGGHKISVAVEKYFVKKVTVYGKRKETLRFSFAKAEGKVILNGESMPETECYPLSLTEGETAVFEFCRS